MNKKRSIIGLSAIGMVVFLQFAIPVVLRGATRVAISGDQWLVNGQITNPDSQAEGLLMNVHVQNPAAVGNSSPSYQASISSSHDRLAAAAIGNMRSSSAAPVQRLK